MFVFSSLIGNTLALLNPCWGLFFGSLPFKLHIWQENNKQLLCKESWAQTSISPIFFFLSYWAFNLCYYFTTQIVPLPHISLLHSRPHIASEITIKRVIFGAHNQLPQSAWQFKGSCANNHFLILITS